MTTQLLPPPSIATATRDDIDLTLLERDLSFLPNLDYARLAETSIDFSAFTSSTVFPADVEAELFRQMNLAKYRAFTLRESITAAGEFRRSELDELLRLVARADEIRNTLVTAFRKLALAIAAQLANALAPIDELMSEAHEAILRAIDKFDPDRGFRFSTYLTHAVRRQLLRFLQRRQRERQRTFAATREAALPDTKRWTVAYQQGVARNIREVDRLLLELKPRDRYVIRARFGWGREFETHTLQEIASELGVTRERVRQLEQRALKKLAQLAVQQRLEIS